MEKCDINRAVFVQNHVKVCSNITLRAADIFEKTAAKYAAADLEMRLYAF